MSAELQARALDLADRWADLVVRSEGVPLDQANRYGMAAEQGSEVGPLSSASEEFQEAARWLIDRGLAELLEDEQGDVIVLKESA